MNNTEKIPTPGTYNHLEKPSIEKINVKELRTVAAALLRAQKEKQGLEKKEPLTQQEDPIEGPLAIKLNNITPEHQEGTAKALGFENVEDCLSADEETFAKAKARFKTGFRQSLTDSVYHAIYSIVEALENERNRRKTGQ